MIDSVLEWLHEKIAYLRGIPKRVIKIRKIEFKESQVYWYIGAEDFDRLFRGQTVVEYKGKVMAPLNIAAEAVWVVRLPEKR